MSTDSYTSQEPGSKRLKTGESVFARRGVSPSTGGVASAYSNESEKSHRGYKPTKVILMGSTINMEREEMPILQQETQDLIG